MAKGLSEEEVLRLVAAAERESEHPVVMLTGDNAGLGLLATAFVSARIVFVLGRLKKRARRESLGRAARSAR